MSTVHEGQVAETELNETAIASYLDRARRLLAEAQHLEALAVVRNELTGKSSPLGSWKRSLGTMAADERRSFGLKLNGLREAIDAIAEARRDEIEQAERATRLSGDELDLTEVGTASGLGHSHVITQVREELEDIFLGMGYEIAEGPEAESDWHNFTALNIPPGHPARSAQDSFYLSVGDGTTALLRSQTSPVQIRLLERGQFPIYAVAPGRVFRKDTADARHLPVFHQIEGFVVDKGVTFADLAGTIETFVKAIFSASTRTRLRPAYFPFTEPSAEFEVTCTICDGVGCRTCGQIGWIELGGCGMVHPRVFEATGLDPELWSGFAFGFGIDRLAIMRHEIEDMRSFVDNDIRFLSQF